MRPASCTLPCTSEIIPHHQFPRKSTWFYMSFVTPTHQIALEPPRRDVCFEVRRDSSQALFEILQLHLMVRLVHFHRAEGSSQSVRAGSFRASPVCVLTSIYFLRGASYRRRGTCVSLWTGDMGTGATVSFRTVGGGSSDAISMCIGGGGRAFVDSAVL